MWKYIFIILLLSFQPIAVFASGEVYSLDSYIYNNQGYIVNIGIDTVSVFIETDVTTPISSIQLSLDPRTCDLDTNTGTLYIGCGIGKKVLRYSFTNLNYIDEFQTTYEVWELEVIEDKEILVVATSEWPDTSQGWFNIWEAPPMVGWITSYNTSNLNEITFVSTLTCPDGIVYDDATDNLYVVANEIIYTQCSDGQVEGDGYGIDILDPDDLSFLQRKAIQGNGYNLCFGPAGYLYLPSLADYYYFYGETIDGVGLIEYELDAQGKIVDHRLIDVGVKKTSEVIYNPLYNEVYINHFGEDPDFVIYDVATEEYEIIEFTDKIWIHFCLSTDGTKLFFAEPDTNEILTYDLT